MLLYDHQLILFCRLCLSACQQWRVCIKNVDLLKWMKRTREMLKAHCIQHASLNSLWDKKERAVKTLLLVDHGAPLLMVKTLNQTLKF